jgi:molybdopterin/thiamine biosynthesis adenylyltransferase/rhodanese-related sulfurtransferase
VVESSAPSRLSPRALRRYSRHLLIPEVALAGQERLVNSRALVIGAGGLGSPVLQYLAAAGVGRIGVADDDVVDETNLQRQTLFVSDDIGKPKAALATKRIAAMNPHVNVDCIPLRVGPANARELVRLYDVVVDCTDRFESRYAISDACVLEGRPDVYGSIYRFDGHVSVFGHERGPCYRCLFPDAPPAGTVPTCAEGGVLGVLAGIVGAYQANEALKLLLHIGEPLAGRLLLVDALASRTREVKVARDPACAICGDAPSIAEPRGDGAEPPRDFAGPDVSAAQLDAALKTATLLDVRESHEAVLGFVPGTVHIPASQFEERMHELNPAERYIVACRVGVKSQWAAGRLRDAGFTHVAHLRGGLLAYAALDPEFAFF